ncbi:TOM1-like protein 1 [Syzygium oleosum]|uniref:TOM1-like protein 1 n=1 Tax=Syzygium oleosum TaxID=219896 RepID=UPI0011D2716A|nr:TOM1-like protein 1 [Syzygium oleosum]
MFSWEYTHSPAHNLNLVTSLIGPFPHSLLNVCAFSSTLRTSGSGMSGNLMEKVSAFGERAKISGAEVGRKMSAGVSLMSFKVKELFQGTTPGDKLVKDATSELLNGPDWALNLQVCDMINHEKINRGEVIRGVKRRLNAMSPRIQYLALVLLETCVKNCDMAFCEVASERVLDDMVKLIDDPQTIFSNRNKALKMIEAWGESRRELRYLPVYADTYKSLKARGICFPGRDDESLAPIFTPPASVLDSEPDFTLARLMQHDMRIPTFTAEQIKEALEVARNSIELLATVLSSSPKQDVLQDELTTTLVEQCREAQCNVQRIAETAGDDEALLFKALKVNDEAQEVFSKYEQLREPATPAPVLPGPAMITQDSPSEATEDAVTREPLSYKSGRERWHEDMMEDLDEVIFGKKGGGRSEAKQDDLISS